MWLDDGVPRFPELGLDDVQSRPSTGLCLSGGGTRATCAAIGYLRGLLELGLIERLRYTSAVSGGSWASIPFSFWQTGASDDRELLGPILPPQELDHARLTAELPPAYLGAAATLSFRDSLFDDICELKPGRAWVRAVAETFLQRYGLYGPNTPRSPVLSVGARDEILARQEPPETSSALTADDFVVARPNRPFPIVSACLLGPDAGNNLVRLDPVSLQFTPLYVGSLPAHEITYAYRRGDGLRRSVGGGLIEPFALGGPGPRELSGASGQTLTLARPPGLDQLALALGSSSCAYASAIHAIPELNTSSGRVPCLDYWPPRRGQVPASEAWELGDGGTIDNYGLLPLLQRELETIIVLVNTKQQLSVDWTPGHGSYQPHIDPYLPPLFGVHEERASIRLDRNQVFPSAEFAELVADLQAAKRGGGPVIAVREHEVLDNAWWGIRGARKVRVAWVYLDRVARFEALLPKSTQAAVEAGNARIAVGPCQRFPNYETIGANALSLVRFTPLQVRLLANLCTWTVLDQRELFEELL
ncbi:Patatin-like phospholipase [Enhygromyxa salina]|uniref:Patatin-like phospholipase n=1 Tax=Enhygromyxa salina TaxID=215803 RepID=A0A2S9XAJ4_9BACT|nr:Patatin-like phospholipase [Enhygromyxa salina]